MRDSRHCHTICLINIHKYSQNKHSKKLKYIENFVYLININIVISVEEFIDKCIKNDKLKLKYKNFVTVTLLAECYVK